MSMRHQLMIKLRAGMQAKKDNSLLSDQPMARAFYGCALVPKVKK
jgi:hypothetical protein